MGKQADPAYPYGGLEAFIKENPYRHQTLTYLRSFSNPSPTLIIMKVSGAIYSEINEINTFYTNEVNTLGGWDLVRFELAFEWKKALSDFIDLEAIKIGEIQKLGPEIVQMIKSIFPNLEQLPPPRPIGVTPTPSPRSFEKEWSKRQGPPKTSKQKFAIVVAVILVVVAIGSFMVMRWPSPTYSIAGRIFKDINENSIIDTIDNGYSGANVYLNNASGFLVAMNTTDTNGYYSFDNLTIGTYELFITMPNYYYNSTLISTTVNITSPGVMRTDFGIYTTYAIFGQVHDHLGNDLQGVTVHIYYAKGFVPSQVTDSSGNYRFENLTYGIYLINIDPPSGCINGSTSISQHATICGNDSELDFGLLNLHTFPTTVQLKYTLHGVTSTIPFIVYQTMYYYCLDHKEDSVTYTGQSPTDVEITTKLTLDHVNEPIELGELLALVADIEAITPNPDDQVRIAISIVQNIPYGYSGSIFHWTYPYEVLYKNKGVCNDKSMLLACLLRELDYGCELFEFTTESHTAVGIKCPPQYAYYQGFAFVEPTTPTIVTYWQSDYEGNIKLPSSPDYVIPICTGSSFNSISEEWNDAQTWNQLMQMGTVLDPYYYSQWQYLVNKYGIQVG